MNHLLDHESDSVLEYSPRALALGVSPHTEQSLFFNPLKAHETTEINIQCYQFGKDPQNERQLWLSKFTIFILSP